MDSIENMRAFLQVCRSHSFVGAARRIGVAPSVVTKRVGQLEQQLGTQLLERSTRRVSLTEDGMRQLGAIEQLVRDYEAVLAGAHDRPGMLGGTLRLSAPAAMATLVLGRLLAAFAQDHPGVVLDLTVLDRSVNPAEEGFDLSLAVLPATFEGVLEEVLCSYPRLLCAAPDYLHRFGVPRHPSDLAQHRCVSFSPGGSSWTFGSATGAVVVPIRPAVTVADSRMVIEMVRQGAGIGVLSVATIQDGIRDGSLTALLPDHPMPSLQLRSLMPNRRHGTRTDVFVRHIRNGLKPLAAAWHGIDRTAGQIFGLRA